MSRWEEMTRLMSIGSGEPVLVFVHGLGCTLEDWRAQMSAFSPRYRCLALDLPGHGGAGLPTGATIGELAAAVNRARAVLDGECVILIGHSLGCKVAREAFTAFPENIVGLVMIEGRYNDAPDTARARLETALQTEGIMAHLYRHFDEMFPGGSASGIRDRILRRLQKLEPTYMADLLREAIDWDSVRGPQTLRDISIPMLVLQSTYSLEDGRRGSIEPGIVTPFMALVERLVPKARTEVIRGCGHFPMIERPDDVNAAIARFVEEVVATG